MNTLKGLMAALFGAAALIALVGQNGTENDRGLTQSAPPPAGRLAHAAPGPLSWPTMATTTASMAGIMEPGDAPAQDDDDKDNKKQAEEGDESGKTDARTLTSNRRPARQQDETNKPRIRSRGPAARPGTDGDSDGEAFIIVEPQRLDLGDIPTSDAKSGVVKLINTGTEPRTLLKCKTSCGCTTANCQQGKQIQPGEEVEVEIKLSAGPIPRKLTKTVTFIISDQPPLQCTVAGQGIAFVEVEPRELCSDANPDGRFVLRAADGQAFRIKSMYPPLIDEFAEESKTEHEVSIPWDKWRELGGQRKLLFTVDHPRSQRVYGQVCMQDVREVRQRIREERGQSLTKRSSTPASRQQDLERLLKAGKHDQAIKLIDDGKIPIDTADKNGRTPLSLAAQHNAVEVIEALLDASADIEGGDRNLRTPLMWAGQSGSVDAVEALVKAGADVSKKDTIGSTALSWAAGFGSAEAVEALLKAGAEVDVVTQATGWTPLAWAAAFGEADSIRALLAAGAKIEAAGILQKATPLMHAVRTGGVENTKVLLEAGASLEARDSQERTPLLIAASNSGADAEVIQLLIDAGADLSDQDMAGKNALDLARKRTDVRSQVVVDLLKSYLGEKRTAAAEQKNAEPTSGK